MQDYYDMNFDYDKLQTGAFYDTKNGLVFSQSGELVNTTDGGNTWNRYDIPGKPNIFGCHMFSNNTAVGFSKNFYRSQDGGQTWKITKSNAQRTDYYFPITSTSGYARMGSLDSVYYTNDQGLTWVAQTKGTVNWAFISFVNPYLAYCANGNGIYRVDFPRPGVVLLTASSDSTVVHVSTSKASVLHIAITAGQAMTAGNVYTVLLSDASGSFTNASTIGSGTAVGIDTITCTIPAGTPSGTGYRIKVTSSLPAGATLVVAPLQVLLQVPNVTLRIPLQKGWNLIATNVYVTDSSIATVFAGKNVAEIKSQSGFWRSNQGTTLNSLNNLQAGSAYMVYMNAVDTIILVGLAMKTLQATSLQAGWNVVGCSYQTATLFSTAVGSVTRIKDLNQLYQITDSMQPGKGYFVLK